MESVEPLFFDQGHQPLPGLKDHLLFIKERYGYAPPDGLEDFENFVDRSSTLSNDALKEWMPTWS